MKRLFYILLVLPLTTHTVNFKKFFQDAKRTVEAAAKEIDPHGEFKHIAKEVIQQIDAHKIIKQIDARKDVIKLMTEVAEKLGRGTINLKDIGQTKRAIEAALQEIVQDKMASGDITTMEGPVKQLAEDTQKLNAALDKIGHHDLGIVKRLSEEIKELNEKLQNIVFLIELQKALTGPVETHPTEATHDEDQSVEDLDAIEQAEIREAIRRSLEDMAVDGDNPHAGFAPGEENRLREELGMTKKK